MELVTATGDGYNRKTLVQTDAFEIVSIQWTNTSTSPMHAHGWSQCLVLIEDGVFENTLDLGAKQEVQVLEVGQVVSTPLGGHHEMKCKTAKGRTLHVYTPKIREGTAPQNFHSRLGDWKSELALNEPTGMESLKKLFARLREQSITTSSPYFMNQLFAGVWPQMLVAEEFIAQTKTTMATFEASPVFSAIELEVVESLGRLIGWPAGHRDGVSVPGGSAANFMAVHCARQKAFPHAQREGLPSQQLKVYVSAEAHYSFKKACAVLGLGTANLVAVPVDGQGRMSAAALEALIVQNKNDGATPLLVAATAGTTVLGAFDDVEALATVCAKHGVWLHVDGAWGGPALFSRRLRPLVRGIERADSVTFDAHKLFGASLTSSFFLTRHHGILLAANDVSGGDYLFHSDDPALDRGKLSWQCGRKADAASFWTIWKNLGTEGLGEFVERLLRVRDDLVPWIRQQERLSLVAEPEFLNICVRVLPPDGAKDSDWSRRVRERMKEKDQAFVNYSANADGSFLRLILAHPFLQSEHVRQILEWALETR